MSGQPTIVNLLVASGLADSKGAVRRTVREGGASVNNAPGSGMRAGRPRSLICCRVAGWYSYWGRRHTAGARSVIFTGISPGGSLPARPLAA
jgi:tyrosyl-tRNA synthetase